MVIVHAPETSNQLEPRSFLFISPLAFFERRQENRGRRKKTDPEELVALHYCFFLRNFLLSLDQKKKFLAGRCSAEGPTPSAHTRTPENRCIKRCLEGGQGELEGKKGNK